MYSFLVAPSNDLCPQCQFSHWLPSICGGKKSQCPTEALALLVQPLRAPPPPAQRYAFFLPSPTLPHVKLCWKLSDLQAGLGFFQHKSSNMHFISVCSHLDLPATAGYAEHSENGSNGLGCCFTPRSLGYNIMDFCTQNHVTDERFLFQHRHRCKVAKKEGGQRTLNLFYDIGTKC